MKITYDGSAQMYCVNDGEKVIGITNDIRQASRLVGYIDPPKHGYLIYSDHFGNYFHVDRDTGHCAWFFRMPDYNNMPCWMVYESLGCAIDEAFVDVLDLQVHH